MKKISNYRSFVRIVLFSLAVTGILALAYADEADVVFDLTTIQEYRITFESSGFWQQLENNAESATPLECTVEWNNNTLTGCGFRIKGNSSQRVRSEKKPFKLEFDEFNPGQRLHGLEHVNFNNCYKDPTFIREVLAYEIFSKVAPTPRANYIHLFLNDEDWGLYVQVEQVEEPMLQTQYGNDNGNLYKGDPAGNLVSQNSIADYKEDYELKTNTEEDNWSDLTNFVYILNNTPSAALPTKMDENLDVYRFLRIYAVNNFLSSLDSYWGSGHNYYFYNDSDYDRFSFIIWDANETFGTYQERMSESQMLQLSSTYVSDTSKRPLATKILAQDVYSDLYNAMYSELLEQYLTTNLITRMYELHNFISPYVLADPKKLYSDSDFENNLDQSISLDGITSIALEKFPTDRRTYLQNQISSLISDSPVRINELMASNKSIYTNELGDNPDWIELYNKSDAEVELEDYYLSNNSTNLSCWQFPDETVIAPYGYLVISAIGSNTNDFLCANFKLSKAGGRLFLSKEDSGSIQVVDGIYFDAQTTDVSYGRETNGYVFWCEQATPTPGAANLPSTNFAPVADDLMISPAIPRPAEPVMVFVTLTDDSAIAEARCHIFANGSTNTYSMSLMVDNVYTSMFAGLPEGSVANYWIDATDDEAKNVRWPADENKSYQVVAQEYTLVINEFMAINSSTIADEFGEYNDWIELYNYGSNNINLTGMCLTDDTSKPLKWQFPEGIITSKTFLVLWADGEEEQGRYHLPFKLSGSGEEIALYNTPANGTSEVQTIVYGQQVEDVSYGMFPDGYGYWIMMTEPTPGTENTIPEPVFGSIFLLCFGMALKLIWR